MDLSTIWQKLNYNRIVLLQQNIYFNTLKVAFLLFSAFARGLGVLTLRVTKNPKKCHAVPQV